MAGAPTPSLVLVKAYNEEEFIEFMRIGIAKGGREVGIMSELSRTNFAHLRDDELGDMFRFFQGLDS